jgi:hypothetical protein
MLERTENAVSKEEEKENVSRGRTGSPAILRIRRELRPRNLQLKV